MNLPAGQLPQVAIVGGGLAGLSAAVALATAGCRVELFEARRTLGGRAGSFRDPATGELVDHCQHVGMGCCTNLADFCGRVGIAQLFRRDRELHFVGPDGRHYELRAGWLPAPLHLAPALWRLKYLSTLDRVRVGRAMWKLMRLKVADGPEAPSIGDWLREQGQSQRAIDFFWSVILTSALGENLDRASLAAARKVIVDGFMAARDGYVVDVPRAPLGALYGDGLENWFASHKVRLHLGSPVQQVCGCEEPSIVLDNGQKSRVDFVVIAVPWHKVADLVDAPLAASWPWLDEMRQVPSSPITGVHLWFDRPIMPLRHAVLVGRLSQWIFNRAEAQQAERGHYYQVVISASRSLAQQDRQAIVEAVCRELAEIWPEAAEASLIQARVVTEHNAVFSVRPGLESVRPEQQTTGGRVLVAGDWTNTGWPSTMESAVRSGYRAADAILASVGADSQFLVEDLPRGRLARWLIRD